MVISVMYNGASVYAAKQEQWKLFRLLGAQGQVIPDSFTHGSGEQRVRWFKRGLESGELQACDTFAAASL